MGGSPRDRRLFAASSPRSFAGRHLREIAFPLGGIGTGCVSLGGRGDLRDWEIFNRPAKGLLLPQTFPAIWAKRRGSKPVARVLARRPLAPLTGALGLAREGVPGLPHLAGATFTGTFPTARIDFEDEALPLEVSLEAWSPFIPVRPEDSGLPVAILAYELTNPADRAVDAAVCFSAFNPIGFLPPGSIPIPGPLQACLGGNVNRLVRGEGFTAVAMTKERLKPDDFAFGSMAIAAMHPDVTWRLAWEGEAWFEALQIFWDDFADGQLAEQPRMEPTPRGRSEHASLAAKVTVEPGETLEVPLILAWHFPQRKNTWNTEPGCCDATLRNAYADRFRDAIAVVEHLVAHHTALEEATYRFREALFDGTLPSVAVDAASANLSTLRSPTVMWLDDGRLHGFEGSGDTEGCCPMDCTHVWNHSQAEAFLFPKLAQSMRRTDFEHNVGGEGDMAFRTLLPLAERRRWKFRPAADGQCGTIVRLFREWNLSGDEEFLRRLWPAAKRAFDFALHEFDPDGDCVPEAERHVTHGVEFTGPDPLTATLFLAAMRAMEAMAEGLGRRDTASVCRDLLARGRERFEELCWNREWFQQRLAKGDKTKCQIGAGCLADQLLGEWLSRAVGLGPLLPERLVKKAARAIFKNNWSGDLTGHVNCQRTYTIEGEPGLLLCTWPRGDRPAFPFPHSDEVWTGIEYATAALLVDLGFVREGLSIVWGARSRHDGERRNPWNEPECGHHCVRAMSSWALINALSGFECSVPEGSLAFDPRVTPEKFEGIWSAGAAWGVYRQRTAKTKFTAEIEVLGGQMTLRRLALAELKPSRPVKVARGGETCPAKVGDDGLCFHPSLFLRAGQTLTIEPPSAPGSPRR